MGVLYVRESGAWVPVPAVGVPPGGTTGQVLAKTSATDYAAGWSTPITQTNLDLLPRGLVGVTKMTANSGSTSGTTEAMASGTAVTWDSDPTRRYKISIEGSFQGTVVGDIFALRIRIDGVGGTILTSKSLHQSVNWGLGYNIWGFVSGLSGSHFGVLTMYRGSGTGSFQLIATSAVPTWSSVEDVGPGSV